MSSMKSLNSLSLSTLVWPAITIASLLFAGYGGWGVYQSLTDQPVVQADSAQKEQVMPKLLLNTNHTRFGAIAPATPIVTGRPDPFSAQ